jgi:cob(I)alamin adenosyltransferase
MKYYTRLGDRGCTSTLGSTRLKKDDNLIIAIGDVDELNSAVGVAIANISDNHVSDMLLVVQSNLFTVGAELASSINKIGSAPKGRITERKVKDLEEAIEELGSTLPDLKKFVLPGGSAGGAQLQLSRAICRRAERSVVAAGSGRKISADLMKYMNRLSSFLFVAALHVNMKEGAEELNPVY